VDLADGCYLLGWVYALLGLNVCPPRERPGENLEKLLPALADTECLARELFWKLLSWLGTIRPPSANNAFDPAIWETFVSTTL
jgi:hypothetical protein